MNELNKEHLNIKKNLTNISKNPNNKYIERNVGIPSSHMTKNIRGNIHFVELIRKSRGYGFTISGQKPCLLRSIIKGSPADICGLRRGHCLVGVNGINVSQLTHDQVVQIISKSNGILRLHVTHSHFNDSSDDSQNEITSTDSEPIKRERSRFHLNNSSLYPDEPCLKIINNKVLQPRKRLISKSVEMLYSPNEPKAEHTSSLSKPANKNGFMSYQLRKSHGNISSVSAPPPFISSLNSSDSGNISLNLTKQNLVNSFHTETNLFGHDLSSSTIENIINDPSGLNLFTEFLEREFSSENIKFYTCVLEYKNIYDQLNFSQRISACSSIYEKYLQTGALEGVNVDHKAIHSVENELLNPTISIFDIPLAQVFRLLKFDCFPRFLKSELYECWIEERKKEEIKSSSNSSFKDPKTILSSIELPSKISSNVKRKTLLPWNMKHRTRKKKPIKDETNTKNTPVSFEIELPDNSTTTLPCKSNEPLCKAVEKLLEKRDMKFSLYEVIAANDGQPIDLNTELRKMNTRKLVRIEPRVFIEIELPFDWKVGVRANPTRKLSEVLKPIISQHSLKLNQIKAQNMTTGENIELNTVVQELNGNKIFILTKSSVNEEEEVFCPGESFNFSEVLSSKSNCRRVSNIQCSSSTQVSNTGGFLQDFLRRASIKYKTGKCNSTLLDDTDFTTSTVCSSSSSSKKSSHFLIPSTEDDTKIKMDGDFSSTSVFLPVERNTKLLQPFPSFPHLKKEEVSSFISKECPTEKSPLTLLSNDLSLSTKSRNRKPICVNQSSSNSN